MSVIKFSARELKELLKALMARSYQVENDIVFPLTHEQRKTDYDKHDFYVKEFIWNIARANSAAYAATYPDKDYANKEDEAIIEMLEGAVFSKSQSAHWMWSKLCLIEYNLVSNNGTDFLQPKEREILEAILRRAGHSMAAKLERQEGQVHGTVTAEVVTL